MDIAEVDHLLSTTRSVKKRMDFSRPVESEVIEQCLDVARFSPTGRNYQGWHFFVVTDPDKRAGLTELYRKGLKSLSTAHDPGWHQPEWAQGDMRRTHHQGMLDSSSYLADHFHEVPAHIICCIELEMKGVSDVYTPKFESFHHGSLYGSILPAAWSIMLALRARGIGSAWTTAHLVHEEEVAQLLGIPDNIRQTVLLPIAYFTGTDFKRARRRPLAEVSHWNEWGKGRSSS